MKTTIALLAALLTPAAAQAMTCAEILAMLQSGTSEQAVVAAMQQDGTVDPSTMQCLSQAGAPASVILAAGGLALIPELSEDTEEEQKSSRRSTRADTGVAGGAPSPSTVARPAPRPRPRPAASPAPMRHRAKKAVGPSYDQGGTEQYTDYGVNQTTLVTEDAQSTFAVDVDTASYTIARSKLVGGALPPASAVRVEEFVNYFPYDDAAPERRDVPFAVHMEAAPSPFVPDRHIMRIGVQGRELTGTRSPVHLTFLVDTSGSMGQANKLPLAKRALHELVDNLGIEDTVALATYAGDTRKVLGPTPVTRRAKIHDAIEQLTSGGGTAMSSGMETAYAMASESYLHGSENRVIVLSDGDANIGRTSHDAILSTVAHHAEEGITLTTVGFGMGNYKDTMMEQLANKGDGNYYYIDSFNEARRVFGVNLSGTIELIAKDVKIQVEFDPEAVSAYRLIGYENRDIADRDFRNDAVDAGEIGSGHHVTALYEVALKAGAANRELATVRLRAKPPGPDAPAREWETTFDGDLLASRFASASPDLRVATAVAGFAEVLRGSNHASEISYATLYGIVQSAGRGYTEDAELLELIDKAAQLSGQGRVASR